MKATTTRLALTAVALAASVAIARAQATDNHAVHHPGQQDIAQAMPAPTPPPAGMPMPSPMAQPGMPGGKPASMGADMGKMMEMMPDMMQRMMAEHGMGGERSGMGMPFEHIEGRIAYLKAELKINDGQTTLWNAFADTLRTNAAAMKNMHEQMNKRDTSSTLPERLAMQQKMMSARLAALKTTEATATPLYAVLSVDQKTLIDQMMSGLLGRM